MNFSPSLGRLLKDYPVDEDMVEKLEEELELCGVKFVDSVIDADLHVCYGQGENRIRITKGEALKDILRDAEMGFCEAYTLGSEKKAQE